MTSKHIEGNSPDLFHEIITTIPVEPGPAHSKLTFAAHGIVLRYEHEGMSDTELNRKVMEEIRTEIIRQVQEVALIGTLKITKT